MIATRRMNYFKEPGPFPYKKVSIAPDVMKAHYAFGEVSKSDSYYSKKMKMRVKASLFVNAREYVFLFIVVVFYYCFFSDLKSCFIVRRKWRFLMFLLLILKSGIGMH